MARAADVKPKVERAAIDLFAARGVEGVSIADIAAAAGVSQGALYRHYRGKDELAVSLFRDAYRRTGADLQDIAATRPGFDAKIAAMIAHFCALYDRDPALFRFLLLAQHNFLPRLADEPPAPIDVVAETIAAGVAAGELAGVDPVLGAAVTMGVVLQAATFHLYSRLGGDLSPLAPALARAALAAVRALSCGDEP
ncbi:MAG TPA: TetR/AcrR family transcriptional regulator [Stellaceae bacterium]|nr:TetR/AcrR family transcriptional regulator [Stellaceae bacterium]